MESKLVVRYATRLTLEGARAVLAAAEQRAAQMNCPMNIAIVDDGGHLLAFARMDGAKPASIRIALTKARGAALRRQPTGAPGEPDRPNVLLGLGLAVAGMGEQTPIRGGFPLVVDEQVIGAIGVSAGTEDQDVEVAQAGVAALTKV